MSEDLKAQVLAALRHPEADEGLYLSNFTQLHEEDERRPIEASEEEVLIVLEALIQEGLVHIEDNAGKIVFRLAE